MEDINLYAPPEAVVVDAPAALPEFYVVSRKKFLVLFFGTFGMYPLYWFYRHWKLYRITHKANVQPVWRAVFAIFFTHSLARKIDESLARSQVRHSWASGWLAGGYVVSAIAGSICDRLSFRDIGSPGTDIASLLLLIPMGGCLMAIQQVANLACGDPEGASNRHFTWANWIWIVLGGGVWLLALVGLVLLGLEEPLA